MKRPELMKRGLCHVFLRALVYKKFISLIDEIFSSLRWPDIPSLFHWKCTPGSMSTSKQNRRPPTIWVSETPPLQADPEPCTNVSGTSTVNQAFPKTFATKERTATLDTEAYHSSPRALHEDPWSTFEPIAETTLDYPCILARYKDDKGRLVHVRKLELQSISDLGYQRTLNRISHSSFRYLLGTYHHDDSIFLAWEHVEVSVVQILASKLVITASEIIAIVKPVSGVIYCITTRAIVDCEQILEGIQYLAECGRVLATLTMNTIFFTQSGKVKIRTYIKLTPVSKLLTNCFFHQWVSRTAVRSLLWQWMLRQWSCTL